MNLNGYKFNLLLAGFIFFLLYLPVMNRPYSFEELRLTSHFHRVSNESNFLLYEVGKKDEKLSQWQEFKKDYLKLYPPFLIAFYYLWSKASFEDEILMRLPLLLLILWSFYELFQMMALLWGKEEASLFLLIMSLFPWLYTYGTTLVPASFGLFLGLGSLSLFLRSLKEDKPLSKKIYLFNLLGLVTLYQFSLLIITQVLVSLIVKERKKFVVFSLIYSVLVISLWVSYFATPVPYQNNPLAFFWGERNTGDFLKLLKVFLSGVLNA